MTELVLADANKLPVKSPARKSFLGIKEHREKQLDELMKQVAQKLMTDMVKGRVSFFHDKKTGELLTEVYTINLKSAKLPDLEVKIWKDFVPGGGFGDPPSRLLMSIFEFQKKNSSASSLERIMTLTQRWDAAEGEFELNFGRGEKSLSHRGNINFLQDILATEIDEEKTAAYFGQPYHKGDFVSHADDGWIILHHDGKETPGFPELLHLRKEKIKDEGDSKHTAYWVRDLLPEGISLLDSGPLPEPKMLKE